MKPVSKTAYYCCGVRMQDADSPHSIINDIYAKRLMGEEGLQYWERFKNFKLPNAGNTARHYIIDQFTRIALAVDPDLQVFLIGAGLDSRAYRFSSGHYFEFDEPAIIQYKDMMLPIDECTNRLQRIPVDFAKDNLREKLKPFATGHKVLIIVEGVSMYLSKSEKEELINTLVATFPLHTLIIDLMKKSFFNLIAKRIHKVIHESGASFASLDNSPSRPFLRKGYRQISATSMVQESRRLGLHKYPKLLVNHLFGWFFMGYAVYHFEYDRAMQAFKG